MDAERLNRRERWGKKQHFQPRAGACGVLTLTSTTGLLPPGVSASLKVPLSGSRGEFGAWGNRAGNNHSLQHPEVTKGRERQLRNTFRDRSCITTDDKQNHLDSKVEVFIALQITPRTLNINFKRDSWLKNHEYIFSLLPAGLKFA